MGPVMSNDARFSEFMYAFATTHELMRLSPWWSKNVPIIPSLRAEGSLGYDVQFDLPGSLLFIQFKLASDRNKLRLVGDELKAKAKAKKLRALAQLGIWQFWTDSYQHKLLRALAGKGGVAYYLAPKFKTQAELNFHFARRTIARSSFIVRLDSFPGPRKDQGHRHRVISPKAALSRVFIFSEPVEIANLAWRTELTRLARDWPNTKPLGLQIAELWKELPGSARSRERRLAVMKRELIAQPASLRQLGVGTVTPFIPRATAVTTPARVRTRQPPWDGAIIPRDIENEYGGRIELLAKLFVLSDALDLHGIATVVVQPATS